MADYGLKISQDGYDVKTASDTELVFSSKFGTYAAMTIAVSGTANKGSVSGEQIEFSINHSLGYTPFILIYYRTSVNQNNWQWFPLGLESLLGHADSPDPIFLNIYDDHFTLNFWAFAGNSVIIKYYLFNVSV